MLNRRQALPDMFQIVGLINNWKRSQKLIFVECVYNQI